MEKEGKHSSILPQAVAKSHAEKTLGYRAAVDKTAK
jgi:hypothetical protein